MWTTTTTTVVVRTLLWCGNSLIHITLFTSTYHKYLHTYIINIFQEFLKKEFSHENIYFWTACERYRKIKGDDEDSVKVRMAAAENIIKRHLSSGAPEPVNVDSHARQAAQEGPPTSHLFATAQKQIYNLMKFDSFRLVVVVVVLVVHIISFG